MRLLALGDARALLYPPPLDHLQSRDRAASLLAMLAPEEVGWFIEIASDHAKLRKARALWNAAKGDGRT